MKFKYKKITPKLLRPVIPVELSYAGKSINLEVLIDSGADQCYFDKQLGSLLDIDFSKCEKGSVMGFNSRPEVTAKCRVHLNVGGYEFDTEAEFKANYPDAGHNGLVGQYGFFNQFIVKFDLIREVIELFPRNTE